jgi:hypothetical protein
VQSTRKKFWEDFAASLSLRSVNLYDEASKNHKLLMIQNGDRFLRLISISKNPACVKCDRYNIKVILVFMFIMF